MPIDQTSKETKEDPDENNTLIEIDEESRNDGVQVMICNIGVA